MDMSKETDEVLKFIDWAEKRTKNTDHLINNLVEDLRKDKEDDKLLANSVSVVLMALDRIVRKTNKAYPATKDQVIKGIEHSMLKMVKTWRDRDD
jgi:hypothetical protein